MLTFGEEEKEAQSPCDIVQFGTKPENPFANTWSEISATVGSVKSDTFK